MSISRHIEAKKAKERLLKSFYLIIIGRWFWYGLFVLAGICAWASGAAELFSTGNKLFAAGILLIGGNLLCWVYARSFGPRVRSGAIIAVIIGMALLEILAVSAVIYYTGGVNSKLFIYYIGPIIAVGMIFPDFGSFLAASLVNVFWGFLVILQYHNVLPFIAQYDYAFEYRLAHDFRAVVTELILVACGNYAVAIISTVFARSLMLGEEEIREEWERIRLVIDNLQDGLLFAASDGEIKIINKKMERYLDISARKLVGRNIKELDLGKYPLLKELWQGGRADGKRITPSSKPDFVFTAASIRITDKAGKMAGTVKIIHDVSREIFMEKMKSEFITIAGHQLRTPLSAVKGALNLLKAGDYGPISDEQKRVLEKSYEYNERLISLLNDLLEVNSVEEGRYGYEFEQADIHDVLREVADRYADDAGKKGQELKLEIVNNLANVSLDRYKIKLALGTLVNNAIKYTPKNGHISIRCEFPDNRTLRLSVSDSGIGIPAVDQGKIFSKFFRAENALRVETEGNGLDLYVAKAIAESHNGKIWFKSKEGRGTTFFIELPTEQPSL